MSVDAFGPLYTEGHLGRNIDPIYDREDLFYTNQRILDVTDANKYHVTRTDF